MSKKKRKQPVSHLIVTALKEQKLDKRVEQHINYLHYTKQNWNLEDKTTCLVFVWKSPGILHIAAETASCSQRGSLIQLILLFTTELSHSCYCSSNVSMRRHAVLTEDERLLLIDKGKFLYQSWTIQHFSFCSDERSEDRAFLFVSSDFHASAADTNTHDCRKSCHCPDHFIVAVKTISEKKLSTDSLETARTAPWERNLRCATLHWNYTDPSAVCLLCVA